MGYKVTMDTKRSRGRPAGAAGTQRVPVAVTLAPDIAMWLRTQSEALHEPMSHIVERALAEHRRVCDFCGEWGTLDAIATTPQETAP